MMLHRVLVSLFVAFGAATARQAVLSSSFNHNYDDGLLTRVETLSALSESEFTTLKHPAFPGHSARIKKSSFCDGTVNSYTGYIDIGAKHLFFYFFESRNDPDKDDVVFWTQGGPGGSSAIGLFMELGPCRILDKEGPKFHPESWNSNANVFFIDQPVSVGFSYADYGESVGTTEEAAKDIAAFVAVFFEHFNKFKGRPFHFAGSSYGGRYLPIYASFLYDQNTRLVERGMTPINLTSVMLGNGMTDPTQEVLSYYDMACTSMSAPPVLDISTCMRMKQTVPRCKKWTKSACHDTFDGIACNAAFEFCQNELANPYLLAGRNPYDITKMCEDAIELDALCYPEPQYIADYLSHPEVQTKLGVDPSAQGNFSMISWKLNRAFIANLDHIKPSYDYVAALLERDVKILVYVGKNDWVCNHIGNERWTMELEWTGKEKFRTQELREWNVGGKVAGETRSAGGLTFATIRGAGHMAPFDKPQESLELVNRWLGGQEF